MDLTQSWLFLSPTLLVFLAFSVSPFRDAMIVVLESDNRNKMMSFPICPPAQEVWTYRLRFYILIEKGWGLKVSIENLMW